jgi:HSP20 family protein
MVMRYDPFRDIDRLTQQLLGIQGRSTAMPFDAYRRGDEVILHFDLPGVQQDDVEVTVHSNMLTVRAERFWEREEGDDILAQERQQGTLERQVLLGEHLDTDRLQANLDGGVLTVRIPVAETAKPRRITVQVGGGEGSQGAIDVERSESKPE